MCLGEHFRRMMRIFTFFDENALFFEYFGFLYIYFYTVNIETTFHVLYFVFE
jgi:hypothetical protein